MMRQKLDIIFVRICVMRRNNKVLNELTPIGWLVVGGATLIFIVLVIIGIILVRAYV